VDAHDLSGTVLDGRYKVIAPLSEGAMGSVYRGERLQLGRAVAIKVMHEALPDELASRQRFEREAKLMAMLDHPHCVSVIDFGVHEDKPFLVMELVRGTSLQDILEKERRLDMPRAAKIVEQVLSGLGHAHELGIIHRDIKPANIMVTSQTGLGEQVRILDFGLARLTEGSTKLTTGIVVGTPNYMAPEQCKGGELDGRTDLYACGVMLFEMLAGRKPFVADDPIAVVRKHIGEPPPRLADVAPGTDFGDFEAVVAKALAKAPADRFASAQQMAEAIEAALKKGAQQVFARAVPQSAAAPSSMPQQATPSGWAVPSTFQPPADSLAIAQASGPTTGSLSSGDAASAAIEQLPSSYLEPAPPSQPLAPDPAFTAVPAPSAQPPSAPVPGPQAHVPTAPVDRRSTSVPPTALPVSRRNLAIGGAALIGVIVLIAMVAGGGHKTSKPAAEATPAAAGSAAPTDEIPSMLARATGLAQAGDPDAALSVLTKARKQYPDSAQLAVAAGKLYFGKLWFTDGVKQFRDALRIDPSLRSDPDIIKTALRGFNTTPDVDDRIEAFLREDIGTAARPYLEETGKSHPNKQIRARAQAELRRIR
jgi:serine/threonine-protein kinase